MFDLHLLRSVADEYGFTVSPHRLGFQVYGDKTLGGVIYDVALLITPIALKCHNEYWLRARLSHMREKLGRAHG